MSNIRSNLLMINVVISRELNGKQSSYVSSENGTNTGSLINETGYLLLLASNLISSILIAIVTK